MLSNLMLDELDKELEKRGHKYCRFADDCNIYVKSERAGQRVMESISKFITKKLKLKVNPQKSAVGKPQERKFLGFSFTSIASGLKRRIAPKAIDRFKKRIKEITRRVNGMGLKQTLEELTQYLIGWKAYFGFCQTPSVLKDLDSWIRRRIRSYIWKQWQNYKTRFSELKKRGANERIAAITAGSSKGPWPLSRAKALLIALPNSFLRSIGLPQLAA